MYQRLLPVLPACLIAALLLLAWPGYLSFDSALQFHEARTWVFLDLTPPLLPALWGILLRLGLPDTCAPLLLIWLSYGAGFGLLVLTALQQRQHLLAWVLALLGPACPLLILLLAQIWTDVLLAGFLLCASGLIVQCDRPGRWRQLSIGVILLMATGLRQNAVLAVMPLLALWLTRHWPSRGLGWRATLGALLVLAFLGCKALLTNALVEQRLDFWAMVPLFDLQAVSVATGVQRLPPSVVGPGMSVDQLASAFQPYTVTQLFYQTRSGVTDPTVAPLSAQQKSELLAAWRRLPLELPWWLHRWRLFSALLGNHADDQLIGLADAAYMTDYADNPVLTRQWPLAHAQFRGTLDRLRPTPAYAPATYLWLGLAALVWRWRRGLLEPWRGAAMALCASAWVYTLPYFLIAPTAETRYVLWPALASWLVFLIALAARSAGRPAASVDA